MTWQYITQQGDTWDVLALDFYGSEKLAHILLRANPQYIDLLYFPAGLALIVPDLPAQASALPKPPWEEL